MHDNPKSSRMTNGTSDSDKAIFINRTLWFTAVHETFFTT